MDEGVEHFLRLQLLLQECCKVLRALFKQNAENDATTGVRYTTLFAYLQHREPDIKPLLRKKVLHQRQYAILFSSGNSVTEEDFDITLLACLLINLFFEGSWQVQWIADIREIRNTLDHHFDIAKIESKQFKLFWKDLETASNKLATNINTAYANEVLKTVKELRNKELRIPSESLDIIKDILRVNGDLRENFNCIKDIKEASENANSVLKRVVTVTKTKNAAPSKRIKTVDNRVEKMKGCFKRTMTLHLPDNFEPPDDYEIMETKLLGSSRRLCLIGSKSSACFTSALHLAKSLNIDIDRCVEMTRFQDWNSIDLDEVGLVLYRDPIGPKRFMPRMVKDVHKCFDQILRETQDQSTEDRCYVIITMEKDIFAEYSQKEDGDIHEIFEGHLDFHKLTTGEDVDSMARERIVTKRNTEDPVLTNMQVQTKTYLEFHNKWIQLPEAIVNDAATLLQQRNMLHIDGPENTGKTSLAAHLMTPFDERCIRLREANDVRHIPIGDGFAILIEDFTGKYKPNEAEALKWFGVFDILLPAVLSGKLNVIIVTDSTSFKLCRLPPHALLHHCLTLKSTTEAVICDVELTQSGRPDETVRYDSRPRSLLEASFNERRSFGLPLIDPELGVGVTGCTLLPNGLFVVAYGPYIIVVDQLDELSNYPSLRRLRNSNILCIATLSFNEVIIGFNETGCPLHCISVNKHSLKLKEMFDIGDGFCNALDVRNGELFALFEEGCEVRVFDLNGTIQRNILLAVSPDDLEDCSLKVSRNGGRLYATLYNRVVCFSAHGNLIYQYSDDESGTVCGMYVDDEDNVLVRHGNIDNSVVVLLDKDGKKKKKVLTFTRGTNIQSHFSYIHRNRCLVVMDNDYCSIVDVKW